MSTLPDRQQSVWKKVVARSSNLLAVLRLMRPKYTVKAVEDSRAAYFGLCARIAIDDLVMRGQLLLPIPGRHLSRTADELGHMKALADVFYLLNQKHNDPRLGSVGVALQYEVYTISCRMFGDQSKYAGVNLGLIYSWDTSSAKRRRLLLQECQEAARWQCWGYDLYDGSRPEATEGLLFACLRNGEFWTEVDLLLKQYRRRDDWGIHQLRIYVGREKWDDAEKFGARLLGHMTVKPRRWRKLAVLGLLAEVKIGQGNIPEGGKLLAKVADAGLVDEGPLHLHPLLCADRLVEIYLTQKRLEEARDLLNRLILFKERMQLSSRMPIGWSPLRGDKHEFSKAVWDAAMSSLSHIKESEGVPEYQCPKNLVIAVLLSLFDNRQKLASLYMQQGRYEAARPILETLVHGNLHPENQTMVACRHDLEGSARVCVGLKDWRNAEWVQELAVELKDRFYKHRHGKDSPDASEDKDTTVKDWEPMEMRESLQLLSRIYRENGSWGRLSSIDFRLLRHRRQK